MAATKTKARPKTDSKAKTKSAQKTAKSKAVAGEAVAERPAWLDTQPITKLIESGQKEGSLNTEEISGAFNKALEELNLDSENENFEDLMKVLEAKGIEIADLAEDEVIDDEDLDEDYDE
ncbi:MAG TPA: RNA polymerase sigma factor region1.1 domain-containing protein, partial [Trueperaceae bacterium]